MNTCKKITNKLVTVINIKISSAGKYKVSVCDASGILGHYAGRKQYLLLAEGLTRRGIRQERKVGANKMGVNSAINLVNVTK